MKICAGLLIAFIYSGSLQAQPNHIRGKVMQAENNIPIAGASIFISSTSKGTTSKSDGSFELINVPAGNYDLVISSIGYATVVISFTAAQLPLNLQVQLKPRASELASVTIEPDEKNGWRKWGRFFLENFIGSSSFAKECRLHNSKALRFRFSKKNNKLSVIADAPLEIENRALGYKLQYQLEEFRYDFKNRILIFQGYILFEELPAKRQALKKRWEFNRQRAYYGSMEHLMRSLYENKFRKEGFEIRRLIKKSNDEKKRVRKVFAERMAEEKMRAATTGSNLVIDLGDSTDYYNRILSQPDEFDSIGLPLFNADSLVTGSALADAKILFFNNYLYVTYKNEKEDPEYLKYTYETRPTYYQRSTLFLPNLVPVSIDKKGNYSPVGELISSGYLGWSGKVANMLPLDYESY